MSAATTILDDTKAFFDARVERPAEGRVALGVSGGPDSMVLLDVLRRLGFPVDVLHMNYHLRGDESDADEETVRSYCEAWKMAFIRFDADTTASRTGAGGSVQARARALRYRLFADHAVRRGISVVAVGHNRDDQVETVMINLLRRSGFDGLAGMRPIRGLVHDSRILLVRPFLATTRAAIMDYAERFGVPWRTDASNADEKYLRSRIRHRTIPALVRSEGERVLEDVLLLAEAMRSLVDESLPSVIPAELAPERLSDGRVPLGPLVTLEPAVRQWLLLRYLRSAIPDAPVRRSIVEAVDRLLDGDAGKRIRFRQGAVWKERDFLRFENASQARSGESAARAVVLVPAVGKLEEFHGAYGTIRLHTLRRRPVKTATSPGEILVDGDRLSDELTVRPWLPGDRFQPFGMTGTKKVKSLLTDRHVPTSSRRRVHVLCDGDRIVWVIGHRMDERYRIGPSTRRVLRISHEAGVHEDGPEA